MNAKQIATYKERLLALRGELARLTEATAESRKPVELDQTSVGRLSRMDAMQGQAMQLETERRRANERQRVESALRRIDQGEFGYCITCGEEIGDKRLAHDPTLPTCFDCARTPE